MGDKPGQAYAVDGYPLDGGAARPLELLDFIEGLGLQVLSQHLRGQDGRPRRRVMLLVVVILNDLGPVEVLGDTLHDFHHDDGA